MSREAHQRSLEENSEIISMQASHNDVTKEQDDEELYHAERSLHHVHQAETERCLLKSAIK